MISSDVLEAQFGPTEVDVLFQNQSERIIQTRVLATGQILELSWVSFNQDGIGEFPEAHARIAGGESMGKVYRSLGIDFRRNTTSVTKINVPKNLEQRFGTSGLATVIQVEILVGPKKTQYCTILETYIPELIWPEEATATKPSLDALEDFSQRLTSL
jgi:hypothetical protein